MSKILLVVLLFSVLLPLLAFAQTVSPPQAGEARFPYWGPLVSCVGAPDADTPAGLGQCISICDLLITFRNTAYFGLTLLVFAFVPVMVLWGGLMVLTSRGNPEGHQTGMKTIYGAVIGMLIGLGAFLIIVTFLWGLGILTGSGTESGEFAIKDSSGNPISIAWPSIACQVAPPAAP